MSGGVDSSVAAFLLKKAGYNVTGVFIKAWSPDWTECAWREDRQSAMRAAAHLGIPLISFDFGESYKRDVVDYLLDEYRAGRTPNPDVMCNKRIKFGAFFDEAMHRGADYIATGHYARACDGGLCVAKDIVKDQTYFLWMLDHQHLAKTLFPIGEFTKPEVRDIARNAGLPNAERKDSQGLCFVGPVNIKDFLKRYIATTPGDVLDEKGTRIGRHDGAILYTIGERHGFSVEPSSSHEFPRYVVAKDVAANTLTVSSAPLESVSSTQRIVLADINWINGNSPTADSCHARVRYRQPLQACRIEGNVVLFDNPQICSPGQSLVVYDGERMLGGGIIV